jgi:hypothetical protein
MIGWRDAFPAGARVAALPPFARPRLYLPLGPRRARWAASRLYPATRMSARIARLASRLAALLGVLPSSAASGLARPLVELVGDRARVVVASLPGTPGPAAKLTLALGDDGGTPKAFLKVGQTPAARRRLAQERGVLGTLPTGLGPPVLGWCEGPWGAALLLGAVPGRPLPWSREPPSSLREVAATLHRGPSRPVGDHAWVVEIFAAAGPLADDWREALDGRDWPCSIRHGDLLCSHVLVDDAGGIALIDWEYGAIAGFPWVDLAHLMLQTAMLLRRDTAARAAERAIAYLGGWPGLSPPEADAIVRLAAFAAHRDAACDGHGETLAQAWRRAIWTKPR